MAEVAIPRQMFQEPLVINATKADGVVGRFARFK
jgi:hypothetical protein